jgi:hypothetical protein
MEAPKPNLQFIENSSINLKDNISEFKLNFGTIGDSIYFELIDLQSFPNIIYRNIFNFTQLQTLNLWFKQFSSIEKVIKMLNKMIQTNNFKIKNNSNNQNNIDDNINKEEKINEINNKINFTKNLDDLIKEAKLDTDNIETTMTNPNNNDNEINKILNNVDTSQTIINKNNNEVNNILKDVQSSNTNFKNIDINNSSNKNINEVQSIDDIRKMFNDDYKPNGKINMSNLYGNNNIRDTQINNIFKSEMITSESFSRNSSKQNGPYKPDFNLPDNYNYNNNYEYNNMNNNPRRIYNIKPSHQHKIRAITNLLEDLNLENLIQVKNRIINKLNGQK